MITQPSVALAIVGSNITAIAAELVAETAGYDRVLAISRRGSLTSLEIVMNGDPWGARLKKLGWMRARKVIDEFYAEISVIVKGEAYDCFIHHSTDPFSQLLSSHPLCRNYHYIEEGFTALIGGRFGRPKKYPMKEWVWKQKSRILYGGLIDRSRPFFDIRCSNFGYAYALSKDAFGGFPRRVQLPFVEMAANLAVPADINIFLDSQYLIGNCTADDYIQALIECLTALIQTRSSVAIKFHPNEKNSDSKARMIKLIESLDNVSEVIELPQSFIGERMCFEPHAKIIVGTTALGFYLGERKFETYSFVGRLVGKSQRFDRVIEEIPEGFWRVVKKG